MGRQWREHAAAGSARRRQDAPGDRARARGHNRRPRARRGINKRTISKKRAGGLPPGLSSCPDAPLPSFRTKSHRSQAAHRASPEEIRRAGVGRLRSGYALPPSPYPGAILILIVAAVRTPRSIPRIARGSIPDVA
jgi:hypothetical protein